jgi:alpha-L-fucosidase
MAIIAISLFSFSLGAQTMPWGEERNDFDQRMEWWEDSRFGMFIHWGLYAIPGGIWNNTKYNSCVEWIQNYAGIKPAEYEKLLEQWNPVNYDASQWVSAAKDAGMKYIVITTRHHEGFSLWPTEYSDFSVKNTPYGKDLLKPLAEECRKQGIKLGFYYSIMDWHHEDYLPRQSWDDRAADTADFSKFITFMKNQLAELIENYNPDLIWFDGEWEKTWTHEMGKDLYNYLKEINPNLIINNRVDKGRQGMEGMNSSEKFYGDFGTPEQEIPAGGFPGVYWESCMTMNNTWGYSSHDTHWKSTNQLITNLADCASKGGNYLLNVGPKADGTIPEASLQRLAEIGKWMKQNGEAIYNTSAYGKNASNAKLTKKDNKIYAIAWKRGLGNNIWLKKNDQISTAKIFGSDETLTITNTACHTIIKLPKNINYSKIPVVEIKLKN